MSNTIRLSSDSLNYYNSTMRNNNSRNQSVNPQPFVSYLQDDDATDEDSDEEFHRVVVTPRLKQHTSRLQDPAFIEGVNHLRKTPINLGLKQFDRNTPNRILQVAMENSHDQDFCGFTPETQSVSAKNKDAFKKNEVQEKEKLFNKGQRKPTAAAVQQTQKTKVNDQQEDTDSTSFKAPNPTTITMRKTYTRKPRASSRTLPEVSESESSYQPDDLSQNSEASITQSPPKPPPRQRGKQCKVNENPKTLPTLNEPVDPRDSLTVPRSPVRKRSAPTKSSKARGNTDSETPVEKEHRPSTSKQPPSASEKSPVKRAPRNRNQVIEDKAADDEILDPVEQQSLEVQPKNSRPKTKKTVGNTQAIATAKVNAMRNANATNETKASTRKPRGRPKKVIEEVLEEGTDEEMIPPVPPSPPKATPPQKKIVKSPVHRSPTKAAAKKTKAPPNSKAPVQPSKSKDNIAEEEEAKNDESSSTTSSPLMSPARTGFRGRLSFLANHLDSREEEEPVEQLASPPPAQNPDQHFSPSSVSSGIFSHSPAKPLRKSRDPKAASPTVPVRPPPTAKPKDFASTPPYSDAHSTPPWGAITNRNEAVETTPQPPPPQSLARTTPFTNAISPRTNTPRSNRMTLPAKNVNLSLAAANIVATPRSSRVTESVEVSGGTKRKEHSNTPQQSPKRPRIENRAPQLTPSVNAGNVTMQASASITKVTNSDSVQNRFPPNENPTRQQQAQLQIPLAETPNHQPSAQIRVPPGGNTVHQQPITPGNRQRTIQAAEETFTSRNIANELENRTINQQRTGTPLQSAGPAETVRFNPYLAPIEDPVCCRMLLSTELYRVVWFTIQPRCIFSLRTYSPTMVMIIKGSVAMRNSDRKNRLEDFVLSGFTRRVADLDVGRVYWAINEGEDEAIFQVTENLA